MKMMYYCKKCHNIVFSEEDYSGKQCFQCEEAKFDAAMISEQEYDRFSEAGELGAYLNGLWGLTAKKILLLIQNNPNENLYFNTQTNEILAESGKEIKEYNTDILNWKAILSDSLKLGKCGELYAQSILETMGYKVSRSLVDDHGIDLLAQKNDKNLLIQVKTVKEGNYTFIEKNKFHKDNNFVVFYIAVDINGVPKVYVFPSKVWPVEDEVEITYSYNGRFTYHPYAGEGQSSKAEYGISGAKKYLSRSDEFCIDTDSIWACDKVKFDKILGD